jgi:hypothetical protein
MERWLDFGAAVFAIVAAVFWFLSAAGNVPSIMTYWGQAPGNDPFYATLQHSAEMNMWAAMFSGLSALCVFFRILCR